MENDLKFNQAASQVFDGIKPSRGTICAGTAFDIPTEILYWVYNHND